MLGEEVVQQTKEFVIEFGPLEFEQVSGPWKWQCLLGIQAELRIIIGGRDWFREPMFPVVELAKAANAWLARDGDFLFDTVEADESPFIWVRETSRGCSVGAAWQCFSVDEPVSYSDVRLAFVQFVSRLVESAREQLGVDVGDIVFYNSEMRDLISLIKNNDMYLTLASRVGFALVVLALASLVSLKSILALNSLEVSYKSWLSCLCFGHE